MRLASEITRSPVSQLSLSMTRFFSNLPGTVPPLNGGRFPNPHGVFWTAPVMGTKSTGRSSRVWNAPRSFLVTTMSRCTS